MSRPIALVTRGALAGVMTFLAAQRTAAQPAASASSPARIAPVPFAVGEELEYRASLGRVRVGTARMKVIGIERVRGRPAYHVSLTIDGGTPFFRVHDRYDSWIDVQTLASLRYRQQIAEGRYRRTTSYEIFPEEALYRRDGDSLQASVRNPLDDASFVYAVRTAGVRVGETRRDDRYFRPDRNPVVLAGLRRDTVTVGAGTFATVVVRPTIHAKGVFAEGGGVEVWFTDDARRHPVRIKTRVGKVSVTLALESVRPGVGSDAVPTPLAAGEGGAGT